MSVCHNYTLSINAWIFYDDYYRRKHEHQVHNSQRIRVKHYGAMTNPFEYARINF